MTQVVVADHLLCGLGSMKWLRGERGSGGMRERRALFVATPPSLYVVRSVQLSNLVLYEAESTYKVLQIHICRTVVVRNQLQRRICTLLTTILRMNSDKGPYGTGNCIGYLHMVQNNRISRDRPVGDQGQSPLQLHEKLFEMLSPVLAVPLLAVPSDVRPQTMNPLEPPLMAAGTL